LELMQHFDATDLQLFKKAFLRIMDEYLQEYATVEQTVIRYDSFAELYADFMKICV